MSAQPEALRIAGLVDGVPYIANGVSMSNIAAELRRLAAVDAVNADLLEALQALLDSDRMGMEIVAHDTDGHPLCAAGVARKNARAAIRRATGDEA